MKVYILLCYFLDGDGWLRDDFLAAGKTIEGLIKKAKENEDYKDGRRIYLPEEECPKQDGEGSYEIFYRIREETVLE